MVNELTQERLKEMLHYDPETGVFTWRVDVGRWGRIKAGTVAGSPDVRGYLRAQVDGVLHLLHRLAFLYMTGAFPVGDVDHKNGATADNRWDNLRDVTHHINTQNRREPTRGKKSGLPIGVSIDRRDGAFRADITVNGRAISLGRHASAERAHAAYVEAKRKLHAGCTI